MDNGLPARVAVLGPVDRVLWRLQGDRDLRPTIAVLAYLDGPPNDAALRQWHEEVLLTDPRFASRARRWPARWEPDPDFSLKAHVVRFSAPSDDGAELDRLVQSLVDIPFAPDAPPWRAYVVDGLPGGTSLYLLTLAHAMSDGLRLVDLLTRRRGVRGPSARHDSWSVRAKRWLRFAGTATQGVWTPARKAARGYAYSPLRRFGFVEIPLAGLKAAADATGSTVNHVFLTALGRGVVRYFHEVRNISVPDLTLLSVVGHPRPRLEHVGNDFGLARLTIPVSDQGIPESVHAVRAAVEAIGDRAAVDWLASTAKLAPLLPTGLVRAGLKRFARSHDLVVSNLPAGGGTVTIGGREMTRVFGIAPLPSTAMAVTLVSYRGQCHITLNIDPAALPNLPALTMAIRRSLEETSAWGTAAAEGGQPG